jgi:hypothetical protein
MSVRLSGAMMAFGLVLSVAACERLPRAAEPGTPGSVPGESLATTNTLPAEWGRLVSVTHPEWASRTSLLWFEDDGGTVRVANYDHQSRRFRPWVSVVRRTEGGTNE